jgi:hypothetical protein
MTSWCEEEEERKEERRKEGRREGTRDGGFRHRDVDIIGIAHTSADISWSRRNAARYQRGGSRGAEVRDKRPR